MWKGLSHEDRLETAPAGPHGRRGQRVQVQRLFQMLHDQVQAERAQQGTPPGHCLAFRVREVWKHVRHPKRSTSAPEATRGGPDGAVQHLWQVLLQRENSQETVPRATREDALQSVWQGVQQVQHGTTCEELPHAASAQVSVLSQGVPLTHHFKGAYECAPGHQVQVPVL